MADMSAIGEIAERYQLVVIEDACQAHGATHRGLRAGSLGKAGAFSFYPGKNLGACGEAGAVTTNDEEVAKTIRMIRDHGQSRKYYHQIEGYNGRLDAMQAAFLRVKLRHLDSVDREPPVGRPPVPRAARAAGCEWCAGAAYEPEWSQSVYHLYVVHTPERDALAKASERERDSNRVSLPGSAASCRSATRNGATRRGACR